jgi:xylulokinase
VQIIAGQVFPVPVHVPHPGEYVADGAARQAAWVLTGQRPAWPVDLAASPATDPHPAILEAYAEVAGRY